MSLAVAFEALGRKLEEEGVVTPTTEAEASVSVHITPEEQTAIDEEVSQYEQVTEAITEAQTAVADADQAEDAEATMSAIVYSIKKHNGVSPQMYAFLQQAGYLDLIARHQSSSLNKVTYPGVEELSTSNTKDVAAQLLAGCEAILDRIKEGGKAIWKAIWGALVKLWEKAVEFFSRFLATGRIKTLGKQLKDLTPVDVKDVKYAGMTKDELDAATGLLVHLRSLDQVANEFKTYNAWYKKILSSGRIEAEQRGIEMQENIGKQLEDMTAAMSAKSNNERVSFKLSEKRPTTLGDAGITYADLAEGGSVYNMTRSVAEQLPTMKKLYGLIAKMSNDWAALEEANVKAMQEADAKKGDNNAMVGAAVDAKEYVVKVEGFKRTTTKMLRSFSQGCQTLISGSTMTVRSYISAASAAYRAAAKQDKKNSKEEKGADDQAK